MFAKVSTKSPSRLAPRNNKRPNGQSSEKVLLGTEVPEYKSKNSDPNTESDREHDSVPLLPTRVATRGSEYKSRNSVLDISARARGDVREEPSSQTVPQASARPGLISPQTGESDTITPQGSAQLY